MGTARLETLRSRDWNMLVFSACAEATARGVKRSVVVPLQEIAAEEQGRSRHVRLSESLRDLGC